ncbi:MAG: hypothetical protein HY559_02650 [Gammaproteobacteria bacterium]|nr:hypothetical protein [Gammaproteobacteria bacterium]
MGQHVTGSGTLGPVSAHLIRTLSNQGKTTFSIQEAAQILGKNIFETSDLLSELVKRTVLSRMKAGIYIILQIGEEDAQLSNWPSIAKVLIGNTPYFLSHYSAMRLHGMTTHPLFDVYITTIKRHRSKTVHHIHYHFVYRKESNFWGIQTQWITKQDKVVISNLERTLLDGLERPELCGGLIEVCRGLWTKQNELNPDRLTEYVQKYPTKAAVKRLGFLLETLRIRGDCVDKLQKSVIEPKIYVRLDPQSPNQGQYLSRWQLRINANIEELTTGLWG